MSTSNSGTNVILDGLIITGGNSSSYGGGIFVDTNTTLNLQHSTIAGNTAQFGGGGIAATGVVAISDSVIRDNNTSLSGGGIASSNDLYIARSTISSNHANGANSDGGGIATYNGVLTIKNSTISSNTAVGFGGGLSFYSFSTGSSLTNVTIAGNTAASSGGVFTFNGDLTISNSTVSSNTAGTASGIGSYGDNATATRLANTVVAGNTGAADIAITGGNAATNTFTSLGHNFIGNGNGLIANGGALSDQVGTAGSPLNAHLGALANNGGPVQTMRPDDNSPLNGAGSNALVGPGNTIDAHGGARKVGTVDIGAYELANRAPVGVDDTNGSGAVKEDADLTATGNVLSNDTDFNVGDTRTVVGARAGLESAGFNVSAPGTTLTGTYGSLVIAANGTWTYTLNNSSAATQALGLGATGHDIFTYRVADINNASDAAQLDISVTGTNDAPVITSNGGGASASVSVTENTTAVTTITFSDVDNAVLTYSLSGAEAARFAIDASGVLTFVVAPDFEAPADADGNNLYEVIVTASDGNLSDTQALAVSVTNTVGHTINGTKKADTIDGSKPAGNAATDEEDRIDGKAGNDKINALGGNDTVKGGAGIDKLDGGGGRDLVDFSDMTKSVVLTLAGSKAVTVKLGGASDDKVKNFESVMGGKAGDKLTGDAGANFLSGERGNDTLVGGKGIDTLKGGLGIDHLTGGKDSADWFVFDTKLAAANADVITDFKHGADKFVLATAIFGNLGAAVEAGELVIGKGTKPLVAKEDDDHLLYNKQTGQLFYDDDGKGKHAAALVATFDKLPAGFDHTDFLIV